MSVDRLLDRLHNVKAIKPLHWVAGCPLCQSRNGRPIAVTEKEGGIILMKPFCGCETGDVLRAVGLRMGDLFPPMEGHCMPPVRRGFDPLQILEALAHEFTVAELIACDVDQSGKYDREQRDRMRLVSQRVTAGVISLGAQRGVGRHPENGALSMKIVLPENVLDLEAQRLKKMGEPLDGISDTDLANSKRLATRHGQNLRYTTERGWFVHDGRRWLCDEKAVAVQRMAKETALSIFDEIKTSIEQKTMFAHAKRSQSKGAIDSMIWLARSEDGVAISLTAFDRDANLFNVANGTVNLATGDLQPHRREDLISNIVEIDFDAQAECELWDAFVWRVTDRNQELYEYLRRFVGYLLGGDTSDQSLHFLYGVGANGKSVFCEVLMRLLGDYAVAVSPELIMTRRHGGIPNDIARLRGVRAALMNETSQGSRFDEAKLKDLTGGDTLTARFLHHEFFQFEPTHKLVIRGNHKPVINGVDEGIWRRLRLVPFSVSIPVDEQDRHLLRKLEHELPGILQWALKGYREWRDNGLKPPAIITEAVREYRSESDTLGRFIEECCEARPLAQIKSSALFKSYQSFCEHAGERPMQSRELPQELQRRGFKWKRTNKGGMFYGIELQNADDYDCR